MRRIAKTRAMKATKKRIKLNWGRLLGFSQVKAAQNNPTLKSPRAMIGQKLGVKEGLKSVT